MNDLLKKQLLLITLILAQLFVNSMSVASDYEKIFPEQVYFISSSFGMLMNLLFAVCSLYLITEVIRLTKQEQQINQLQKQAHQNEKLSTIIKTIKHDINNQVTVIDGMYQLGKLKEAREYTKNLANDLDWVAKVLEIDHPEIASLIINKVNEANQIGIITFVEVECTCKNKLRAPINNVTRVMGNLIDNAIYALKHQQGFEKELCIRICENHDFLKVEIENSGEIDKDIQSKIFEQGFTTKGNEGSGLGLYIVKNLVDSMGGSLNLFSQDNTTKFTVKF